MAYRQQEDNNHTHSRRHHHRRRHQDDEATSLPVSVEDERRCMETLRVLCSEPANKMCADCKETGTQWTSVNLGIFLCIRCAGVHRSLGTHITKVKSTSMDSWTPNEVLLLQALGNQRGEELYEARMPSSIKLKPVTNDSERRVRIEKKYVTGEYAMEDVKRALKSIYKRVGYGAYAGSTKAVPDPSSTSEPHRLRKDKAYPSGDAKKKREDAMRALYGDAPKRFSKKEGPSSGSRTVPETPYEDEKEGLKEKGRETVTTKKKKNSTRDGKTAKVVRGPFGIVNVNNEEEMTSKLANLFRCFGIREPVQSTPAVHKESSSLAQINSEPNQSGNSDIRD